MSLQSAYAVAALIASVLLLGLRPVAFPIVAAVASGLEVLLAFGVIKFGISGLSVPFVLGAALAVVGVLILGRAGGKREIISATVVTMVGAVQALTAMHFLH